MLVLVGFQAFRLASSTLSLDTEVSPKSSTFHTRGRCQQPVIIITNIFNMNKTLDFLAFSLLLLASCKKEYIEERKEIKSIIISSSTLPPPPLPHPKMAVNNEPVILSENDVTYQCTETTFSYSNNMEDVIAFNPNAGVLYPGSLVQGKNVRNGELNSIGSFDRNPLTLTMSNYGIYSSEVYPNEANVSYSIAQMVNSYTGSTIAKISYKQAEVYDLDQGLLELGIDYNWGGGSLGSTFSNNRSINSKSIFVSFIQEYYTVSIEQPSDPSNFFGENVDIDLLRLKVTPENPLCYISSVTYGRMLIAKITSTATIEEMKTAINASISKVSGSISYTNSTILTNSTYEVYIVGGSSTDALQAATSGMPGIVNYLNNGANFSVSSIGFPISYVVRHASDNSIVKMGKALEYTVNDDCYFNNDDVQRFGISIDELYIGGDCDDGIFINTGAGEFTYSFSIKDNDKIISTIKNDSESNIYEGNTLFINSSEIQFNVSKVNSHRISISGGLKEWDDGVSTNLTLHDINLYYPWSEITEEKQQLNVLIDQGDFCWAKLYYSIRKIPLKKILL